MFLRGGRLLRPTGGRGRSDVHLELGRHERLQVVAGQMSELSLAPIALEVEERDRAQLVLTRARLA